jgi:hypothetical protein
LLLPKTPLPPWLKEVKVDSLLETTTATLALELAARELELSLEEAAIRFSTQLKERFQIRHRIGILNA